MHHQDLRIASEAWDNGKGLIVAISDPFNTAVLDWAESRVNQRFLVFLAHRSDIAAYMSRYEENLRAMDSALTAEASTEAATSGASLLPSRPYSACTG